MKNIKISDLAPLFEKLENLNNENQHKENALKTKLHRAYDLIDSIQALKNAAENMESGDYTFNNHGDFCYQIEIDSEIASLPFIDDYLSDASPCFVDLKNKILEVNLCPPITVCFDHDSRSYFVYDHENQTPVIKSFKNDCYESEELARLMIEKYQRDSEIFGDVIEVDSRHGGYLNHLSSNYGKLSNEEFKTLYKQKIDSFFDSNDEE